MAALNNRINQQIKPPNATKPQALRANPAIVKTDKEKTTNVLQQRFQPTSKVTVQTGPSLVKPAPAPKAALPSLSVLRDQASQVHKRQKIIQEIVRTAGKENGFMSFKDRPQEVPDIYAEDVQNEALVVAYVEHIYAYLYSREITISKNYMDGMSINPRMRAILIDWMVSVAYKFKMCQDTLFLSLNIVDRFLSIPELDATKDELQLIGVTAMFIAGKFEEVYPPDLEDYVFISDHACTKSQILDCEMTMINALNFDFTRPLPAQFLRRGCKASASSSEEYALGKYITELAQLHIDFVEYKPSILAAAALYLAIAIKRRALGFWNANMVYYTSYEEAPIKQLAAKLFAIVRDAPKSRQQCIVKKYSSAKLYAASVLSEQELAATAKLLLPSV